MKVVKNAKPEAMSENVKFYYKKDCTERCPNVQGGTEIGSVYCLYLCKHCIKKDRVAGWIICEKLNKEIWSKKSAELIGKLPFYAMAGVELRKIFEHCNINIPKNNQLIKEFQSIVNKIPNEKLISDLEGNIINQTLNKMKRENINIEIPKGYVPEVKDGKVTLIYKGDPLDEMPKSWKELKTVTGEYFCGDCSISEVGSYDCKEAHKDVIPKGLGKPMLALIQLLQLRNKTWEVTNSKPNKDEVFRTIAYDTLRNNLEIFDVSTNHPMKFSSKMVASRFLEYHKDLLWEARELL